MRKILASLSAGIALTVGLLTGCGGNDSASVTAPAASTTISGSAVKGPVNGATVTARAVTGGAILGTTTTSPSGTYSLVISYNGDVVIEVSGGNYIDEATGLSTALNQLKAVIRANGGAQTVHVTPLTYIAYGYSGVTSAGFNTALANLSTQFGLGSANLLTTLPAVTGTMNDYGRVLSAMSKYVQLQGLANFEAYIGQALNPTTFTAMQANFLAAFTAINGSSSPLTFTFNGTGINISGTGAGGGTGTCGVAVSGTISGFPINQNYCISGIAANACNSGLNASLNSALQGVSLNYAYSSSCASGAFAINLTP